MYTFLNLFNNWDTKTMCFFWLKYTLNTNGELIALSYMIDKICSLIYALRGHLKCSYIFQYFFSLTDTHIYSV